MAQSCETCRFWGDKGAFEHPVCDPGETANICRRRAPSVVPKDASRPHILDGFGGWPMTVNTGWCGEWEARA